MKKRLKVIIIGLGILLLCSAGLYAQTVHTQLAFVSNDNVGIDGEVIFNVQLISTTGAPTITAYQHSITMSGRLDDAYTTHTLTPYSGFSVNSSSKSGAVIQWQLTGSKVIGTSWTDVLNVSIEYTTEGNTGSILWGGGLSYTVVGATTGSPQSIPGSLTDFPLPVQITQSQAVYQDGAVHISFNKTGECRQVRILKSTSLNGPYDAIADLPGGFNGLQSYLDRDVQAGFTYYYQVEVIELDQSKRIYGPFAVTCGIIPEKMQLLGNYPNPFNPETTIRYDLPEDAHVQLKVFNLLGNEIITLINDEEKAGEKSITWNGLDKGGSLVGSGIYFYKLVIGTEVMIGKMLKIE